MTALWILHDLVFVLEGKKKIVDVGFELAAVWPKVRHSATQANIFASGQLHVFYSSSLFLSLMDGAAWIFYSLPPYATAGIRTHISVTQELMKDALPIELLHCGEGKQKLIISSVF